ncbi:retrovirus-related pol polyprotein from transposon TNT 1-94 [Tanacetum coccineum]
MNEDKIKKDLEEIETITIELDHREKLLEITALKNDLKKLKGNALVDNAVTKHTIDPKMLNIDVEPITPKLLNKKIAHSAYIKHTQEEATVLRDLVEHVKSKYPLDHSLKFACSYAKLIQELLTHISKTCPSVNNTDGKLMDVTPKNKDKRFRFTEPITSSGYTITKTASTSNLHSKLNANLKLKCVKCNGCLFSDNHDLCVLDFINNVNARKKSKSTFTVVGNAYPLTRITTTAEVPLRKLTALENETPKPVVTLVYSKKPRKSHTNVPVSKSKVLKSVSTNKKEPSQSWGSIVSDVPSSSLDECRLEMLRSQGFTTWKDLDIKVVNLLTGSRGNNLYTLSLGDMMASSLICLLSKASKTKTDNGTEFVNQTLREYYEKVDISHETSFARSPQQNGVVERRNLTLIEASRTMLIYAKAPLFLWAEVVATACYTQNRSIICLHHGKTPYELLHDKPLDLLFFHVFGALCYPTNDSENLGKLQPKADIDFDKLTAMASEHSSLGPALHEITSAIISSGLMPNPPPLTPFVPS